MDRNVSSGTGRERVLVVDDDPDMITILEIVLSKEGYTVVTASRGNECLEVARRERPGVALIDFMLPDLNGLEIIRRLRAEDENLQCIAVTGQGNDKITTEIMNAGAVDYLVKPFESHDVASAVQRALENRRIRTSSIFRELAGELEKKNALLDMRTEELHRRQVDIEKADAESRKRILELDRANEQINRLALELKEKNRSLDKAVKNISALNRVGVALSSELDIDRVVQLLINISVKGLRVEIGYIMLMEERSGNLVMRAWSGLGESFDPTPSVAPGESVSGRVVKSGRPLLIRHVDGRQGIKPLSRFGFARRSVLCVPIRIKNRMLGTIELANKKGDEDFTEEDLAMLQSIANQAAIAIENANLYLEVQRSYLETIRALVQAMEEKDKYTRGHSERVTAFSVKIARKMGVSSRQIQMIRYAGVLHDIGKIGIDIGILHKKGGLSKDEFQIVRNHPLIGERIIKPIGFLADVIPGVSQHHERYDGCGYPLGLNGEQTVLEARILAVADAYDAMITERPYRKPLPKGDAIAELRRCAGTQFDPLVVENFVDILENDPEIIELETRVSSVGA